MSGIQPITLNTAIGTNQQTLMESPIFKSLFRDISSTSVATTSQNTSQLLPNTLANIPLLTVTSTPTTRYTFTAQQIALLIFKISPQGVTLASLKAYPTSDLTPVQQQIRDYFISSPIVFNALAKLDRNKATLSNQDIQIAAQLVKNVNKNANQTPVTPSVQNTRPAPAQQPLETPTQQPTPVVQAPTTPQVQPNQALPTPLPQTVRFTPNALPIPTPIVPVNNTPADVSKNERVRAYAGYSAMQARRKKRGDDVEAPDIETILVEDPEQTSPTPSPSLSYVKPFFVYKEKIELDANEVKKLFEKIAGKQKKLTLFHLRDYQPENAKEDKIVSILKHLNVYKELSHINHHEDLELEDIEIATHGKDFLFSDGHLDLIIHASTS